MASGKYGVRVGEWWKHLRWTKQYFWKRHRQYGVGLIVEATLEEVDSQTERGVEPTERQAEESETGDQGTSN